MRLALISPYPPSKGTLNEYAFHLVQSLKEKEDIEELVILTDVIEGSYPEPMDGACKISIVPCWSFNSLSNPFRIVKALKAHRLDMALFNIQFLSFGDNKLAGAIGLLGPLLSRFSGIPAVTLLHNITETVDYKSAGITENRLLEVIYNVIGTMLTCLLLCSNMLAVTMPKYVRILEKKYRFGKVALVPHGSFEIPELPVRNKSERQSLMTFGKFGTYKKVEELIEAVLLIRARTGRPLDLVIAGTDNPNVRGYLKNVQDAYAQVNNITYTGYVEEEDVPGLFQSATVVVFPYTSTTGSSGVLHQAGGYAKSVVLPNIGDLKELIEEEGYRGEYFEPGDINGMANAIENLLNDEPKRIAMEQANFAAAASLPMTDIADWYLMHFSNLDKGKITRNINQSDEANVVSYETELVNVP